MVRHPEEQNVIVNVHMKDGPGEVPFRHLASKEELLDHARLCAVLELKTGCGIGWHVHHGEAEYYYVLRGTPTMNDNGTERLLHPGDFAMTSDGEGHSIENRAEETAEVLALILLA